MINTWHKKQEKNIRGRFLAKWNKSTIEWITTKIEAGVDELEIKFSLCKAYGISVASASLWVNMTRRIMQDVAQGASLDAAIEADRNRRNEKRRKTAS